MSINLNKFYFVMGRETINTLHKADFQEIDEIRQAGAQLQRETGTKQLDDNELIIKMTELLEKRFPDAPDGTFLERVSKASFFYDSTENMGLGLYTVLDPRKNVHDYLVGINSMQLMANNRTLNPETGPNGPLAFNIDRPLELKIDPNILVTQVKVQSRTDMPANPPIQATPYITGVAKIAKKTQRSVDDVSATRSQRNEKRLANLAEARKRLHAPRAQKQANDNVVTQPTAEQVIQAKQYAVNRDRKAAQSAKINKLSGYRQVAAALEPYVSRTDLGVLRSNIDRRTKFTVEQINAMTKMVIHLNNIGADFYLQGDNETTNRISAVVDGEHKVQVRILDHKDNGNLIGQVFTDEGAFHYGKAGGYKSYGNQNKEENEKIDDNPFGAVDYALGRVSGQAKYGKNADKEMNVPVGQQPKMIYSTGGTAIQLDGGGDLIRFKPRRRSVPIALTISDADDYLNNQISTLRPVYLGLLLGPDLTNIDADISADQKILNDANELINATPEEQAAAAKYVKNIYGQLPGSINELSSASQKLVPVMASLADSYIGERQTTPGTGRLNFDHVRVLSSKASSTGSTYDQLVGAFKRSSWTTEQLIGTEFGIHQVENRLVQFDSNTGRTQANARNPEEAAVLDHVSQELRKLGLHGSAGQNSRPNVLIDDNGIIAWSGARMLGQRKNMVKIDQPAHGEIGQVFLPDNRGIIHTNFGSKDNYDFVPGIKGYFRADGVMTGETRMSRLRGEGYNQILYSRIDQALRFQMMRKESIEMSRPTDSSSLNKLYNHDLYGKRLAKDWLQNNKLEPRIQDATIATMRNRVRFPNKLGQYAGSFSESQKGDDQPAMSQLVDGKNMRILEDDYKGVFDMTMTGTNKTQGVITYMGNGAKLNQDGTFEPARNHGGEIVDVKAPVRELPEFKFDKFNAWDRNQMASNQILTGLHVDHNTRAMLSTFGGWTFDDSAVISKELADRNLVPAKEVTHETAQLLVDKTNEYRLDPSTVDFNTSPWSREVLEQGSKTLLQFARDKQMQSPDRAKSAQALTTYLSTNATFRPLTVGDKISDFGGNKATIGLIVDRNMNLDTASANNLTNEVDIFNQNPDLDLVMSPYSVVTRDNTGVVKELMDKSTGNIKPVQFVDSMGEKHSVGYSGTLDTIITDLTADSKTHAYTKEDQRNGKSRSASGQLNWAADEMGATGVINELWGHNQAPFAAYREYLTVAGYDMSADGTLQVGYHAHPGENRTEYIPDLDTNSQEFVRQLGTQGGMLKLPFELDTHVPVDGKSKNTIHTNGVPVMSASLRRNQELMNGTMQIDDYTRYYEEIYKDTQQYLKSRELTDPTKRQKGLERAQKRAQTHYDTLRRQVIDDKLGGRHGEFKKFSHMRTKMMSKRLEHAATAVQTADPRLPLDTIKVSNAVNQSLDRKYANDLVMIWRDPCLRGAAITGMKAVADSNLTGMAVNPIVAGKYDGDFDGDTLGLNAPQTRDAQRDLATKLYLGNNTMDLGSGNKNSVINVSMDLVSSALAAKIVEPTKDNADGKTPKQQLSDKFVKIHRTSKNAADEIQQANMLVHSILRVPTAYGSAGINLTSRKAMLDSVSQIVNSSAKGKPQSVKEFAEYFDGEKDQHDAQKIQRASGYKSDLTGVAGSYSQKLLALMRDHDPKAALEVTYPNTQGVLQVKHSPEQAVLINEALMHDMKHLFKGISVNDADNAKAGTLTRKDFIQELTDIYTKKLGLDVDPKYINAVGDTLSDTNGIIQPVSVKMQQLASPMDQIAYGAGITTVDRLARENRSITEGKNTSLLVPDEIVHAGAPGVEDILVKSDVQDKTVVNDQETPPEDLQSIVDAALNADRRLGQQTDVRDNGSMIEREEETEMEV